jgi:hypothetical protein
VDARAGHWRSSLRVVAHDRLWVTILLNSLTPYLYLAAYPVLALALAKAAR